MDSYLILHLSGPMQSWGQSTFEGLRPTAAFPTRSGLLGVLGACLGIRRNDKNALQALADSVRFAVRCDNHRLNDCSVKISKFTDYHTVKDARVDYVGLKSHDTIQTWREYLCDAHFTVALWCAPSSHYKLESLVAAVQKPWFTPYLGRRSCPLSHPLYLGQCEADNPQLALSLFGDGGVIYSEEAINPDNRRFSVRDEPIVALPRQFAVRDWFVIQGGS
ncbi:type I-E CRISPR-associated protein Cas5/CasD [Xenorhabdus bovienii]|uniref:type I-E CRISPR-associated protein Cas5/CasD n=1 Tax=Xenorhabdus bovienii TaxID=40576 RepID=UPI00237C9F6E|nr:type I-E CRISPR-associated protein Cas5/CasD [Xenorhabdus bovienii]MDE1483243.1 type I-E CRISPR-associated protein Cas5/CasD [Xenorhabdus bovienii]MDE9442027.1 type I-E CRISPR-associated protein Cas5/CasD [Xenorhabdus bovienii]MDE9461211.1 type I-E CRISPR-associated protein Cas5/CasD [Xenorhabdus bovienii]MDE9469516.1 type I-E CRISPR-associated protein Cas5/CasD [Xenorhabdus bovienii]